MPLLHSQSALALEGPGLRRPNRNETGFVRGLADAETAGHIAGGDSRKTEADNPYKRAEHRHCWLVGFRAARFRVFPPTQGTLDL